MHGDMAGLLVGVDEVAYQAVPVAVEVDADQFTGAIEDRAAGVAADGVGRRDEVKRRRRIQFILGFTPALGQYERLAVPLLLGALKGTAEGRGVRQVAAVDAITLDHAKGQPQSKSRIGGN